MLSKIDAIKTRVQSRSKESRSRYLREVSEWKKKSEEEGPQLPALYFESFISDSEIEWIS